ncbi:MAG: response regulator [Proteobacteria bacterium]|nr:response regulator [Pseudomonadota bacterium]
MSKPVVLIVEDEVLIRMEAIEMIRDAGFEVVEAADADEAVTILEARTDIVALFTDIQMPGSMDGLKLARAVRDRWPPIKILAASGNVKLSPDDLPSGGQFLQKPYTGQQIKQALHKLIGVG